MKTILVLCLLTAGAFAQTLGDEIAQLHNRCAIADLGALRRIVAQIEKQRGALPHFLTLALPRVRDEAARTWIVTEKIRDAKGPVLRACVEAAGIWRRREAVTALAAIVRRQLEADPLKRDVLLLYEAARSIGRIGGPARAKVFEACATRADWRIRLAAAENMPQELLPTATALLVDVALVVRITAASNATRPYVPELIAALGENNRRLRRAAQLSLERLAGGKELGDEPGPWSEHFKDERAPQLPKEPAVETIHFVMDTSLQMDWPKFAPNRVQVARREVERILRSLREPARLNVMVFGGFLRKWMQAPAIATFTHRKEALLWLDQHMRPEGVTNTFDALMQQEGADDVFFYAGGIPNSGLHASYAAIFIHLRNWNRLHKVRFNTYAINLTQTAKSKMLALVLKRIAEESGGRHKTFIKPFR